MSNKDLYRASTPVPDGAALPFSFAPNSGSAVDQTTIKGRNAVITSVTRTGAGVFDVVLKDAWDDVIAVTPSIQLNADADATMSSWNYVAATRTLTLRFRTAGAAADVAANANNRLGAVIHVRNIKSPTY